MQFYSACDSESFAEENEPFFEWIRKTSLKREQPSPLQHEILSVCSGNVDLICEVPEQYIYYDNGRMEVIYVEVLYWSLFTHNLS